MKQDMRNKKRKMMEFAKSLFMVMMVFLGVLVLTPSDVKAWSPKGIDMAYYYVAKGQPCTFQDPQKGTISIKESAGNKCKVSGNKITVICPKEGDIVYTINGKKRFLEFILVEMVQIKLVKWTLILQKQNSVENNIQISLIQSSLQKQKRSGTVLAWCLVGKKM